MIGRRVHEEGLSSPYKENKWQRELIRKCFSLAFIAESDVLLEFEKIVFFYENHCEKDFQLESFFEYFRKQFLPSDVNSAVGYNISFWSCYQRVIHSVPRTSNALESWHHVLNEFFPRAHPNIAAFINTLSVIEQTNYIKMVQAKSGKLEISGRDFKKEELRIVCVNYNEFDIEIYFKMIEKFTGFKTE